MRAPSKTKQTPEASNPRPKNAESSSSPASAAEGGSPSLSKEGWLQRLKEENRQHQAEKRPKYVTTEETAKITGYGYPHIAPKSDREGAPDGKRKMKDTGILAMLVLS